MSPEGLLSVAATWSFWEAPPPPSIPRRIGLPHALRPDVALVVQGVRRCGKSTLLGQLIERYGLDRARCLFINFEDTRLAGSLGPEVLQELVAAFEARCGTNDCVYFLD